jgi:16S rRNA (guanine(966)-N(2))-methyltransferase RsmD
MRIISGSHKGIRIVAPKKLPVRPTTDRSKEALFNILQHQYDWSSIRVLDLFSGTGSISYEFASRGVTEVFSVDKNSSCIKFIQQTAEKLDLKINTMQSDTLKYLSSINMDFDLIFADPPYNLGHESYLELVNTVFENNQLKKNGLLILEHSNRRHLESYPQFSQARKYGNNIFSFFEK